MLTFSNVRIFFILLFTGSIVLYFMFSFSIWYLCILPVLFLTYISYGSSYIGSNVYLKAICRLNTAEKIICLSFDDGPHPTYTLPLLDLLDKYEVKALFFLIGKNILGNETIVQKIHKRGHTIGNHSFDHSYVYDFYSTSKVTADLVKNQNLLASIIGFTPIYFRPPYGVTNPNIAKAIAKLGLITIGWNVRSLDTIVKDKQKLYRRIMPKIKPGSIILFHDTNASSIEVVEEVILFAKKNGYTFAEIDKLALN